MKSFAKISIRLLSIYFAVRFIGMLGSLMTYIVASTGIEANLHQEGITSIGVSLVINAVLCTVLWGFSEPIAEKIVGPSEDGTVPVQIRLGYEEAMKISIKMAGLIIIVMAVPEAINSITNLRVLNMNMYDPGQSFTLLVRFLMPYVQIAIGTVLISSRKLHDLVS